MRASSLNGKPKATTWRSRDLPSDAVAFGLPLNELVAAVPR
jgi:hypothetical protein